jgi:hypothetical protein
VTFSVMILSTDAVVLVSALEGEALVPALDAFIVLVLVVVLFR